MANYTQENGPRARLGRGRNRNTLQNLYSKQEDSGLQRGGRNIDVSAAIEKMRQTRKPPTNITASSYRGLPETKAYDPSKVIGLYNQATANLTAQLPGLTTALNTALTTATKHARNNEPIPAGIRAQLIRGFRDAGRPDLARMVRTSAFDTFIGAESGWNSASVSPANNQGMPNGGLFQFWYGHPWAQQYFKNGRFTASPYQQALFASKYFDLTPEDIRNYAAQIRAGDYPGWG